MSNTVPTRITRVDGVETTVHKKVEEPLQVPNSRVKNIVGFAGQGESGKQEKLISKSDIVDILKGNLFRQRGNGHPGDSEYELSHPQNPNVRLVARTEYRGDEPNPSVTLFSVFGSSLMDADSSHVNTQISLDRVNNIYVLDAVIKVVAQEFSHSDI